MNNLTLLILLLYTSAKILDQLHICITLSYSIIFSTPHFIAIFKYFNFTPLHDKIAHEVLVIFVHRNYFQFIISNDCVLTFEDVFLETL